MSAWGCTSTENELCFCTSIEGTPCAESLNRHAHREANRHDHAGHLTPVYKESLFEVGEITRNLGALCNNRMRIESTEARERRFEALKEATGESAKSKAIDVACKFYLNMAGDTIARPDGYIDELLGEASDKGSLTPEEIATILDTDELPVEAETTYSVG
jgi:hypothetical protein